MARVEREFVAGQRRAVRACQRRVRAAVAHDEQRAPAIAVLLDARPAGRDRDVRLAGGEARRERGGFDRMEDCPGDALAKRQRFERPAGAGFGRIGDPPVLDRPRVAAAAIRARCGACILVVLGGAFAHLRGRAACLRGRARRRGGRLGHGRRR
ncbi:hypothetical protein, partial [Burkholderia cenocepacia]|uniref:hypothetical protein n=1 Tax=Burkholderia cenocepacia TaxID=95486 RepID=UPI001178A293